MTANVGVHTNGDSVVTGMLDDVGVDTNGSEWGGKGCRNNSSQHKQLKSSKLSRQGRHCQSKLYFVSYYT